LDPLFFFLFPPTHKSPTPKHVMVPSQFLLKENPSPSPYGINYDDISRLIGLRSLKLSLFSPFRERVFQFLNPRGVRPLKTYLFPIFLPAIFLAVQSVPLPLTKTFFFSTPFPFFTLKTSRARPFLRQLTFDFPTFFASAPRSFVAHFFFPKNHKISRSLSCEVVCLAEEIRTVRPPHPRLVVRRTPLFNCFRGPGIPLH